MMGLSDGERISMIRSAVLIQYTRVSDGRTDGRTDAELAWHIRAIAYMLSRVKTERFGDNQRSNYSKTVRGVERRRRSGGQEVESRHARCM